MNKKRLCIFVLSMLFVGMIGYFPAKAYLGEQGKMTKWGQVLSQHYNAEETERNTNDVDNYKLSTKGRNAQNFVSGDEVFEEGTDVLVTKKEVEIAKELYILQGLCEDDAENKATQYMEEYNAMYIEAIDNGFDVSDKEIEEYISNSKMMSQQIANADEFNKIISQFDSEEEYWEYEKTVSQKQLPIQKYVASLENKYSNDTNSELNTKGDNKSWNKELDIIKKNACEKQKFKKIDSYKDINQKYKICK